MLKHDLEFGCKDLEFRYKIIHIFSFQIFSSCFRAKLIIRVLSLLTLYGGLGISSDVFSILLINAKTTQNVSSFINAVLLMCLDFMLRERLLNVATSFIEKIHLKLCYIICSVVVFYFLCNVLLISALALLGSTMRTGNV